MFPSEESMVGLFGWSIFLLNNPRLFESDHPGKKRLIDGVSLTLPKPGKGRTWYIFAQPVTIGKAFM